MTRVTERVLELEAKLTGPVSRAEPEGGQFDFARTAQAAPREDQWASQETAPIPIPFRTAQPEQISRKPPRARVARRRINRTVILALVVVLVIALGMVAVALVSLETPPSSTKTTTCTIAAGGAGCSVGGSLYVTKLDVAATPYNGSYVTIIVLTVKNNGTNPITMSSIQFDSTTLQNGPPAHGGIGNGIWSSSANPIANSATAQLIINVPATSPSSHNGTHAITLVDSSGTSYRFSITISLQ